jgi:hypothetical protein
MIQKSKFNNMITLKPFPPKTKKMDIINYILLETEIKQDE